MRTAVGAQDNGDWAYDRVVRWLKSYSISEDEIDLDMPLVALGIDAIDIVEFEMEMEEELELPVEDPVEKTTPREILEWLRGGWPRS